MDVQVLLGVLAAGAVVAFVVRRIMRKEVRPFWPCQRCGYQSNFQRARGCKSCGSPR